MRNGEIQRGSRCDGVTKQVQGQKVEKEEFKVWAEKKVLIIARSFPTGRMEERMEFKQSLRVLQYFLQTEQNLSYFSIVLQIQAKKAK